MQLAQQQHVDSSILACKMAFREQAILPRYPMHDHDLPSFSSILYGDVVPACSLPPSQFKTCEDFQPQVQFKKNASNIRVLWKSGETLKNFMTRAGIYFETICFSVF
jgi:hypothetical protein